MLVAERDVVGGAEFIVVGVVVGSVYPEKLEKAGTDRGPSLATNSLSCLVIKRSLVTVVRDAIDPAAADNLESVAILLDGVAMDSVAPAVAVWVAVVDAVFDSIDLDRTNPSVVEDADMLFVLCEATSLDEMTFDIKDVGDSRVAVFRDVETF